MISTGDTASVLKQQTSRSVLASGTSGAVPGHPATAFATLASPNHPTLALAAACAHGLKG